MPVSSGSILAPFVYPSRGRADFWLGRVLVRLLLRSDPRSPSPAASVICNDTELPGNESVGGLSTLRALGTVDGGCDYVGRDHRARRERSR